MSTLVNRFSSGKDGLRLGGGPLCSGPVDAGVFLTLAPCGVDVYCPPVKRTRISAPLMIRRPDSDPKRPASLDSLPDECLFEILRRVPSDRDRGLASCVSKRLLFLLSSIRTCESDPRPPLPDLNEDPARSDPVKEISRCFEGKDANDVRLASVAVSAGTGLTKLALRSAADAVCGVTSLGLRAVARCCPGLKALLVWNAPFVTDAGLVEIADGCPSLEKLDLSCCPLVSDKGISAIAESCPNLVSVNVEFCNKIGDSGLRAVGEGCPKLQSLTITGCPAVTDQGIAGVMSGSAAGCLRRIKLQNLNISDASVACVGYYGREVTDLVFSGLSKVGERGFWVMANTCGLRKLSTFSITACDGLTDLGLRAVAKGCPGLKQLSLRKCANLSDTGLNSFFGAASSLEGLRLEECDGITFSGLLAALTNCGSKLSSLALSKCTGIKDFGKFPAVVPSCTAIRSISVRNCPGFGSSSIASVVKLCPRLQHVDLRGLPALTDDGLLPLVESGKAGLVKVNLSGCPNLTDTIASAIASIHGSTLESLNLEGCKKITDASLITISENCSVLGDLDISESSVTDRGIVALSSSRQLKLRILSLSRCTKITNRCLPALGNLGKSLVGLNLQRCGAISSSGIGVLEEKMWWCDILS